MDVEIDWDDAQRVAVAQLDVTAHQLRSRWPRKWNGRPKGTYLWGPVGRGKTAVMDDFSEKVTVSKRRVHFHAFFQELHRSTHAHGSVDRAMNELLHGVRLLCFDEFHVHDVGDATLLARLLAHVEERGITLVVTSNYPPEGLLPNPLFHHAFLPSIEWLETNLDVLSVDAGVDYRAGGTVNEGDHRFASGRYVVEVDPTLPGVESRQTLRPGGRGVVALAAEDDAVWFDFGALCETPTAASEYLVLAQTYRTWTISGVPHLGSVLAEPVRRFGNVIDVLYDANVALTIIADRPLDDLVAGADSTPDVDRLRSRLSLLAGSEPTDVVDLPVR
ncbi:cell division protein ZapE [Rhodococcus sp. NPDC058521]|uniref:cell division protein ZapE n=1 Tax=Rhodococcus sp. NPDC058521 TaxID=3346536 RepID=UPI003648C789